MAEKTEVEAAHELETAEQSNEELGGSGLAVIPAGFKLDDIYSKVAPHPRRAKESVSFTRIESFIQYLLRHAPMNVIEGEAKDVIVPLSPDLIVWAKESDSEHSLTAVLNETSPSIMDDGPVPGWRDWQAHYVAQHSTEFKKWTSRNGQQSSQEGFADIIEQNLPDIIEPDGATMLSICRSLTASKKASFASEVRTNDGIKFNYGEEIEAEGKTSKGSVKVPEVFKIAIPIFRGGPKYSIDCKLRYRLSGGRLSLWYELYRLDKIVDHAFTEECEKVTKEVAVPLMYGDCNNDGNQDQEY